ncbi:UvrD-helicase domain-containing protein [Rhodococcus erythropolis]|uniref:UvrD-helicase domain-containing protein n=1 Tax=Rhodococcus erythropolis TaxID=1833 RepID=UPI001BE8B0DF|nr:UvrD-helicase domain-containing protein [Rhodococcus erythropolis]MBT2269833.1 UvrD-helicase domain-containing protein [Rhodococcus erythropolis]
MTTTSPPEIDLTTIIRGSVTAPAGFGKTQVIASTIAANPKQRFLVLTHTNAGVRSLHNRIRATGAHRSAHIETISGLALRLARAFPTGSHWNEDTGIDHPAALDAANTILQRPTVLRALLNGYDQIIVDEYQDCSIVQHEIITRLADHLSTVVLGDPLQAIFDFKTQPVIPWTEVTASFPTAGILDTPHRWSNTNPELGQWLRTIRAPLTAGQPIKLPSTSAVDIRMLNRPVRQGGLHACIHDAGSTVIIIPNSGNKRQIPSYAKTISNRASAHEAAEQPELLDFVAAITGDVSAAAVLLASIEFAIATTTGVTKPSQVTTLRNNLKKSMKIGHGKNDLTDRAADFISTQSGNALAAFIIHLTSAESCATYRPGLLYALLAALRILGSEPLTELPDAARKTIDARRRIAPRSTARCSVGSTLLVKGLEYDYVTLIEPARVPSAKHLYVALSRARHKSHSRSLPIPNSDNGSSKSHIPIQPT